MRVLTRVLLGLMILALPGTEAVAEPVAAGLSFAEVLRQVGDDPVPIDWRTLAALDLETGDAPASLKALDGKRVVIAAFIVPLEDDMQQADEFLLVPYFGACIHVPPPPANQIVYVTTEKPYPIEELFDAVHVTGSADTHDAIVWGPQGEERRRRLAENDPLLTKPITSELGNVTPWIVVPGEYSERELQFQAENVAAMIANNASFNCIAAKMIVPSR